MRFSRPRLAALAATAAAVAMLAVPSMAGAQLPIGGVGQVAANFLFSPDAVAGANNWSCRPSAAHPYPVVLVPATFADLGDNFAAISPTLANAGYCVYGFNYGDDWLSLGNRIGGLTDIAGGAQTLASFVAKVKQATHAAQVDLVGHSQGGLMPNYYLKFLGGASQVHTFVALAPSNHGTTLDGLVNLANALGGLVGYDILGAVNGFLSTGAPSLAQQEVGSSFETHLFAGGDTVPGPRYVVIETTHDEVVTPYTNAFLSGPNVENILIQNQCPSDPTGHVGIMLDSPTLQDMLNALGADSASFRPSCSGYGLGV